MERARARRGRKEDRRQKWEEQNRSAYTESASKKIRKTLENRMNDSSLGATDLERRCIIKRGTYYRRLREAGDIRLKELWGMEQAGVKFSDADLLAMFGR